MAKKALSHNQVSDLLRAAIKPNPRQPGDPYYWIRDVFPDHFIYENSADGKLFKRTYSIDAKNAVTLGEAEQVVERKIYEPVVTAAAFSVDFASDEGELVVRKGKVFEVGDYPTKQFALDEAEADAAIADFSPVPNNLEHRATILDGQLGDLRSLVRKGKDLFAEVAIPKWLNKKLGQDPLKVSLEWDRATKRVVGNGLVLNPAITDAAVFAAFSGRHDLSGDDPEETTAGSAGKPTGGKPMNFWDKLKALFSEAGIDPEAGGASSGAPAPTAEFNDLKAKHDAAQAQLAAVETQQVNTAAAAFAGEAIRDNRALPAEKDTLVAMFAQAVRDDNAGKACFSADGKLNEGNRVDALRKMIAARPKHQLTEEQIRAGLKDDELAVVFTKSKTTDKGGGAPQIDTAKVYADREKAVKGA